MFCWHFWRQKRQVAGFVRLKNGKDLKLCETCRDQFDAFELRIREFMRRYG